MIQEVIIYILLGLAVIYIGFRIYSAVKKKQDCDKCELMKQARKAEKK